MGEDQKRSEELIHNVEAFRAARAWAVVHGHQQPDDRMLMEYGAKIVEAAYRAGREDAAREIQPAVRRLIARIVANAHLLDVPFTDAPDRSPWTQMKPAMHALFDAAGIKFEFGDLGPPGDGVQPTEEQPDE